MAGPSSKSFTGKGMTWKIGGAFPFSGPYQYYETIEADGLRLAAQHIPQLGGPTIDLNLQDFGGSSGVDTQKAVDAMLNFHDSGNGMSVSGIQGALGSLIPGAERYKIRTPRSPPRRPGPRSWSTTRAPPSPRCSTPAWRRPRRQVTR